MELLIQDDLGQLLDIQESPCISLYQPTHKTFPDNEQDPIRFKNLLKTIEHALNGSYSEKDIQCLIKSFHDLSRDMDFWRYSGEGLAIFASPACFKLYKLPRTVPELAIVSDSFHLKPLIRLMQAADRYQILDLTRDRAKLYEGNRYSLSEVPLASEVPDTLEKALGEELTNPRLTVSDYGKGAEGPPMHHGHGGRKDEVKIDDERFFRKIDEAILKYHSKISQLPLILATLPEHQALFHQISKNPYLLEDGIKVHKNTFSLDELCTLGWQVMGTYYHAKVDKLTEQFAQAKAKQLGSDELRDISEAAVAGKIQTLFIDADRRVPGRLDYNTGKVQLDELLDPEVDDLLDDVGEVVLRTQGQVFVISEDKMPTKSPIAAIYRY